MKHIFQRYPKQEQTHLPNSLGGDTTQWVRATGPAPAAWMWPWLLKQEKSQHSKHGTTWKAKEYKNESQGQFKAHVRAKEVLLAFIYFFFSVT